MEQTRSELKDKFQDGDIPTGTDFANLIDSFLNFEDDGMTSYQGTLPGPLFKRFGIGDTTPESPLGIRGEDGGDDGMISFTSNDGTTKWNINLNPSPADHPGFSIDDISTGTSMSRFFIQPTTGYVGIGTFLPEHKLHIEDSATVDYVSEKIRNTATFDGHPGYLLGHYAGDDTSDPRDGAFAILEDLVGGKVERITVLPQLVASGGHHNIFKVGVNEMLPYATLHVSRPADDPLIDINLAENTGILLLGQIEDKNLGFDAHEIQARTGAIISGVLSFTATPLGLQPRGGDINIHSGYSSDQQITITDTGKIGVGKDAIEKVDINGAITIADSANPSTSADGTIRWDGTDFLGRKDGTWVSLTSSVFTDGIWTQPGGPGTGSIYFLATVPRVGIGADGPTSTLEVFDKELVSTDINNSAVLVETQARLSDSAFKSTRIGLEVQNNFTWGANVEARDIGIYVSNVAGQAANHEGNIAALFNGNTVVGSLTSGRLVGSNARNVLAIQTGSIPTSAPGTTNTGGVQIYSNDLPIAIDGTNVSVLHFMNGDTSVMKLYKQPAIYPNNINNPNTGNPVTDLIISDTRQRVLDIENALRTLGLLA